MLDTDNAVRVVEAAPILRVMPDTENAPVPEIPPKFVRLTSKASASAVCVMMTVEAPAPRTWTPCAAAVVIEMVPLRL